MNTLTGWQKVAILAIMMAAIPLTFAFVAPAASAVTGIATTLVGSLFLNFQKGQAEVTPELVAALAAALSAAAPKALDPAPAPDAKESK